MTMQRIAPLAEQVANSLTSVLLTLILAAILTTEQFGVVSYLLIALVFPLGVIDSLIGAGVIFDARRRNSTTRLRRGVLITATLAAVAITYLAAAPLLLFATDSMSRVLKPFGGPTLVALAIATYCFLLGAFEQLRRTSYAADQSATLLKATATRCAILILTFLAVKFAGATFGLYGVLAIAATALALAIAATGYLLVSRSELAWRFSGLPAKVSYIKKIISVFWLNAGTTLAYSALEVILLTAQIGGGDNEAVARYRGLQLALLVVNLLAAATENANAARLALTTEQSQSRFRQTSLLLLAGGAGAVLGFLLLGKPLIAIFLGPNLVPTTFELLCGCVLMMAQIARTPFAIQLKFDNRFTMMFAIYVASVVFEVLLLIALYYAGLFQYALITLVIAHVSASIALIALGWRSFRVNAGLSPTSAAA